MARLSWTACCRTWFCHVPPIAQFIVSLCNAWLFWLRIHAQHWSVWPRWYAGIMCCLPLARQASYCPSWKNGIWNLYIYQPCRRGKARLNHFLGKHHSHEVGKITSVLSSRKGSFCSWRTRKATRFLLSKWYTGESPQESIILPVSIIPDNIIAEEIKNVKKWRNRQISQNRGMMNISRYLTCS